MLYYRQNHSGPFAVEISGVRATTVNTGFAEVHVMEHLLLPLATVLVVLLIVLLIYLKKSFNYWKTKRIPYLEPSFPFGNFEFSKANKKSQGLYFKDFYEEFKKMRVICGGVYAFHLPVLVSVAPDFIKNVLVKSFVHFPARNFYKNEKDQPSSANLFTLDGAKWRSLRTKLTPIFTSAKVKNMFDTMVDCGESMDKYVSVHISSTKSSIDIKDCVGRLTTDIIGSCAFGIHCESFRSKKSYFHVLMMDIIKAATSSSRLLFMNTFPNLARFFGMLFFPRESELYFSRSLDQTIDLRAKKETSRNDFLDMLIELRNKELISLNDVKGQCLLFFLAGYETSATTLTFCFFELACNQKIQDALRTEISRVLSKYGGAITYQAVSEMKYLASVLEETLRKYPPIPVLFRKCVKEYAVPETNIVIEEGTNIIIPTLGLHYDPEYFANPEVFDPNRFSEENKSKIVPYTYLPFGDGPRNCIGSRFGLLQAKVGVVSLLRKYKITLNSEVRLPLDFTELLVLTPSQDILLDFEPIVN